MRFSHTALVASLAGGLSQYHDSLGVALVDCLLEQMRHGLDHPAAGEHVQRRCMGVARKSISTATYVINV